MGLFNFRKTSANTSNGKNNIQKTSLLRTQGFEYLNSKEIYLDSACQSLRPQPVIDSFIEYYQNDGWVTFDVLKICQNNK